MSKRAFLVTATLVASSACVAPSAEAPAPVSTAPLSAAPAPTPAPTPAGARGTIVGTVATNPWHDIKGGAVVYLEDAPRGPNAPPSATLDNHDMEFVPNIVTVAAGGSVIFTNTDPMAHNVFSPDGEKWNLGEIPQNGSVVKRFDTPGSYVVLCNLHQSMRAYLLVSPSSYFARSGPDGAFAIKNVPPGTYHVSAWAPRLKKATQAVTVGGEETTANFSLER